MHAVLARSPFANTTAEARPNLLTEPFLARTLIAWLGAFETYNALQLLYYILATLIMAMRICKPEQ